MKQSQNIIKIASFSLALMSLLAPLGALALTITVTPSSGAAGSQTTISGLNAASTATTVSFDGTAIFSGSVSSSVQVTIPLNSSPLAHTIAVVNGTESASATFTVIAGAFSEQKLPAGPQTKAELLAILDTVVNWFFTIFIIIAIIFIILAAFQFITGGGDTAKISEARQKLIWATLGIIVALIAKGFPVVIRNILGA